MILGMATSTYTLIHVVISLIGIGSGIVVLWGMIRSKPLDGITAIFLTFTVLTSLTGFGFPFTHVTPGIIVGVISMVSSCASDCCAIWLPSRRSVAPNLRGDGIDGALFERVRSRGSIIREGAGFARTGANAIGAAVCGSAAFRSGVVHHSYAFRGTEVSTGSHECCLSHFSGTGHLASR